MSPPSKEPFDQEFTLVRVRRETRHSEILYALLKDRSHNISHSGMPSFEEHDRFVKAHPYRAWYIVESDRRCVGSVYLLKSNNLGIHISPAYQHLIPHIIKETLRKQSPLPGIKSVRAPTFSINVAPSNQELIDIIEKTGGKLAQLTYVLSNYEYAKPEYKSTTK